MYMSEENLTMQDLEQEIDASLKEAEQRSRKLEQVSEEEQGVWDHLLQLQEDNAVLDVTVSGVVKGGVIAIVDGIRGFIPASKLSLSYVENLEDFLKKDLKVQILDVVPEEKRLVLSAKELLREAAKKERQSKMAAVQVGLVTEGTVETIKPYGAFIDLGDGISGLLHVSQISEKRIKTPADVLSVGDTVKVKVIAIKDGKLSLSVKALAENTAEKEEEEHYELPKSEAIGTSLGSLFKDLKL
jgi:small subunit ribosomal protein S1